MLSVWCWVCDVECVMLRDSMPLQNKTWGQIRKIIYSKNKSWKAVMLSTRRPYFKWHKNKIGGLKKDLHTYCRMRSWSRDNFLASLVAIKSKCFCDRQKIEKNVQFLVSKPSCPGNRQQFFGPTVSPLIEVLILMIRREPKSSLLFHRAADIPV